ncbi:DUF4422 domain-containing protein [Apilactobacillus kunkeei]|uniref:DUF4422 domain-containing protein n=1 Tax=Apilactobacillus kunkeei TaxID=148814 RepID=UPI00403412E5
MNSNILIVSHKNVDLPNIEGYQPIQVGKNKETFDGYIKDNTGENIANKNANYCELTAQYWLWKNDKSDIKGLVHYRRFFEDNILSFSNKSNMNHIVDAKQVKEYLSDFDLILPKKRNYFIETLYSHYIHSHRKEGLDITEMVIETLYPDYIKSYRKVMSRKKAHMFNMIISNAKVFDEYSEWLFNVLGNVEQRLDITDWNQSESRVYGYISELLLDVWLDMHPSLKYKELRVGFIGNQHWIQKIYKFIARKIFKK